MPLIIYLNGIDVIGDNNQLGFFLLNQGGDSVDTVVDDSLLLGRSVLLAGGFSLCALLQAFFPLLLSLGAVVVHETKQLGRCNAKGMIDARQHLVSRQDY